jgi:N-acetylglucosaminyl-diphospho-decaprenol L-rhamnosyltransferase
MRLDVVCVSYHSAPLIGRTIAIARALAGPDAVLIVVDNSPGDGAATVVRSADPDAAIISNRVNRGYAAAVNQAIAASRGDVVLLVNPDVERVTGSVANVEAAFADPRVGAAVPRLVDADGTVQPSCIRAPRPFDMLSEDVALAERFPRWRRPRRYRMLDWDHATPRRVDAATGACLFLRRTALADVGPFDERFFVYYEETDWLTRAKARGWETAFVPALEATHASAGSSPGARARPSLLLLESQHRYARKHFGPVRAGLLRATLLGIDSARLVRHARSGDDRVAEARERIRVHLTLRAPHPS